ncbi:hypothetical protein Tco_1398798, partial [Tanacetum coccineum]
YLVEMDTESKPFEDLGTKSPESPHTIVSPGGHVKESESSETSGAGSTSSDSTTPFSPDHPLTHDTPVSVPPLRRTACMAVLVQPMMSLGCFARIAEVAAMSDVAFCKRFRPPYESSPSPSPTLPVRKRYRGTSELVLSTDSEAEELGDTGDEEDSLDSDSGSKDAKDEGLVTGDEDPGMRGDIFSLGEDETVLEGQQRAAPVVETVVGEPSGLGQGSGSAPKPKRSERVSTFRQLALTTWTNPEDGTVYIDVPTYPPPAPPVQTPPSPESLEQEQERAALTFMALWRPVVALEAWAGRVDARMASTSQVGYDDHRLVHELLVQQAALQREL